MNIDRARWFALAAIPLLASCEHDLAGVESASSFGEANRQTMITITKPAQNYFTHLIGQQDEEGLALRISVDRAGTPGAGTVVREDAAADRDGRAGDPYPTTRLAGGRAADGDVVAAAGS